MLLAALPEVDARAILMRAPLPPRTPRTITAPEALIGELARVRAQGFAVIDQEVELGLRSIAAPLLTARGKTVAALNVGLLVVSESSEELAPRCLPALRRIQSEVKRVLR